jgi:NADPH:quinone reductase
MNAFGRSMKTSALLATIAAFLFGAVALSSPAATNPVPETMRAAAFDKGGGPEVLSIHTLPVPRPKEGEVLIAVHAAGIGVWDADIRRRASDGGHGPIVLGGDGSGTVVAVGSGVHDFKAGDRIYGTNGRFYAEYTTAPANTLAHIPRGVSFTEASILAVSGLSALQGIDDVLQLKPGERVIIHGATGGVGTLAVQLAKLRGAKVLATASNDEGVALLNRLGADVVVNGRTADISAAAQRFAPQGVDAVFGLAGGDALEHCIDALRHDGQGRVAYLYGMEPLPKARFAIRMTLYSFIPGTRELERLNKAVEAGKFRVPIAAEYPLADAAEAHQRLEAGHLLGKIALVSH